MFQIFKRTNHQPEPVTITLGQQDTSILPARVDHLRVVAGTGWLSYNQQNLIVRKNEVIFLDPRNSASAAMTSVDHRPLVIELYSEPAPVPLAL